ncbi:MAG: ArgP/LysG family DNA-binding transcriptional regulator [Propionicimonas sp.]|uniref:ArgP/LysG family DNA-binding transcriptional regulator n=1 Tax=Propionicimonas sp. TaxID=1955623 RepID=UPI003D10AE87
MEWDLAQLRALAAVADHGTLEAASRELHLTPSAVSQRLKALERSVGAVLLRRTRPVTPTDAGRPVLLLARQLAALTTDAEAVLESAATTRPVVRLAVNADSLATWVLPALASVAGEVRITFVREDQDHTADLLRDGSVMAAITSQRTPVQGCTVESLGAMRYRPIASREFAARWFADGVGPAALAAAPVVVFDDHDRLQTERLEEAGVAWGTAPWHMVPASTQFSEAVRYGYGWGMLPDLEGRVWDGVDLAAVPGSCLANHDVALYWQQWSLQTASLDAVAAAVRAGAAASLRHP